MKLSANLVESGSGDEYWNGCYPGSIDRRIVSLPSVPINL